MKHRHLRFGVNNRVAIWLDGLKTWADIENISMGGALIRGKLPVEVGDLLAVQLEDSVWPIALEMYASVIRKQTYLDRTPAIGLQFYGAKRALRTFLKQVKGSR